MVIEALRSRSFVLEKIVTVTFPSLETNFARQPVGNIGDRSGRGSYAHLMNNFLTSVSVSLSLSPSTGLIERKACGVRYKGATGPRLAANPSR